MFTDFDNFLFPLAAQSGPLGAFVSSGILLSACIIAGVFGISLLRRYFARGSDPDRVMKRSVEFLEGLKGKGGLTSEEMRRVRSATMRKMAAVEEKGPDTSLAELGKIVSVHEQGALQAPKPANPVAAEAAIPSDIPEKRQPAPQPPQITEPAKPKAATRLRDILVDPPPEDEPARSEAPPAEVEAPKPPSVDLGTLLEKGLISQEKYDRLSAAFSHEKPKPEE